jgi:LPXTG-motif cell wall-anchored protein
VEDYYWTYDRPTAVVVNELDTGANVLLPALGVGVAALVGVGGALLLLRRKRTM